MALITLLSPLPIWESVSKEGSGLMIGSLSSMESVVQIAG